MSARCREIPEDCDRNYCQRENRCAERAASAPAESPIMNTPNPTPAPDMAVEARLVKLTALITDFAIAASPWLSSEDATPGDRKAYFEGFQKVTSALRAALARPQEVAVIDDAQVKAICAAAGVPYLKPIPDDDGDDGYPGGFDMTSLDAMRRIIALAASRAPVAVGVEPDEFTKGVNHAAAMLDKMADDYADEHGTQDPDTGATEFKRGAKEDHYNTLRELADDIRSLVATPSAGAGGSVGAEPAEVSDEELAAAIKAYNVYDDGEQPMAMHAALKGFLQSRKLATPAPSVPLGGGEVPIELQGIAETMTESGGWWSSCGGCHESNEGYDTGPYSAVFKCALGGGCSECGGIGAVWSHYTDEEMALMAADLGEPPHPLQAQDAAPVEVEGVRRLRAAVGLPFASLDEVVAGAVKRLNSDGDRPEASPERTE